MSRQRRDISSFWSSSQTFKKFKIATRNLSRPTKLDSEITTTIAECSVDRKNPNGTGMSRFLPSPVLCRISAIWPIVVVVVVVTILVPCGTKGLHHPPTPTVQGLSVRRAPLRWHQTEEPAPQPQQQEDAVSPYCFALRSMLDLPTHSNSLATQVWPSARVAAMTLEARIRANDANWCAPFPDGTATKHPFTICELGCGPGLPSLAAAAAAATARGTSEIEFRVIATDVDDFALELVAAAAREQGLDRIVSTRRLDLIDCGTWAAENQTTTTNYAWLEDVDLFVLSDVFESNAVARGAAQLTQRVLSWPEEKEGQGSTRTARRKRTPTRMWVFAQTDRTQRETYLRELQQHWSSGLSEGRHGGTSSPLSLDWKPPESYDLKDRLWLCDVDETTVDYG